MQISEIINNKKPRTECRTNVKKQMNIERERNISTTNSIDIISADAISLQTIMDTLKIMFPEQSHLIKEESLRKFHEASCTQAQNVFTAEDAERWGDKFTIPNNIVESDEALFRASMRDIDVMVNRRKARIHGSRLNPQRVALHVSEKNPEKKKIMQLATSGMPLLLKPGFIANGDHTIPPLRKTYLSTKSAVDRLLFENFHQKGLAFILMKKTVMESVKDVHFSPLSWAEKHGKVQGRPIGDCSDGGPSPCEPINSKYTKDASDELWGQIHHPSIDDVARMVLDFYEREKLNDHTVKWEDIRIFKMDLKGAFTLLTFETEAVRKLAMEMSNDLVMIFLCGVFGWTGTPAAFQVLNRTVKWEINQVIHGVILMYSDDIIGVTLDKHLEKDLQKCKSICTNLLGPDAVEDSKTESGRRLTVLGFDIDLNESLVTISEKNIMRAFHGFMKLDTSKRVNLRMMQQVSSWRSRYSNINVLMKPFVHELYSSYQGRREHVLFKLQPTTARVIKLFRLFLALTALNEITFSRSLVSFKIRRPTIVVEFDASLKNIGVLYYKRNADGSETPLGGGAASIAQLDFGVDASFQNTAEFIAAVLGISGLVQLGITPTEVELRGDSITALSWASKTLFHSDLIGNASLVFVMQSLHTKIHVAAVTHLTAADNWRTDYLSRGGTLELLGLRDDRFIGLKEVNLENVEMVEMCNPSKRIQSDSDFFRMWMQLRKSLGSQN